MADSDAREVRFRDVVVPELPVLLRVGRRLTGNAADAEDLVQETVLRAYRGLDGFDGRHVRAWLLTIQRNAWRNMNRRQRPHLVDDPDTMPDVPARGADGRGGAEETVMDATLDASLAAALADLPTAFKEAIALVDVDGLSYQEAADVLGVPVGTIMSRLHRGRKRLRKRLAQEGVLPRPVPGDYGRRQDDDTRGGRR